MGLSADMDQASANRQQPGQPKIPAVHFVAADHIRRALGNWLDTLGYGPQEAPWREVARRDGARLRAYGPVSRTQPVLVIVPAPIKRAYIWDLEPESSVIRRALSAGIQVYLLEWIEPHGAGASLYGLADYADLFITWGVETARVESRCDSVLLAGHSLGGTLAAIFAALHPERVRGLVLVEAPLRFGAAAGSFAPYVLAAPAAPYALREALGTLPGSLLTTMSAAADPATFAIGPMLDGLLSADDPTLFARHLRAQRWTLDEFPLAGRLFEEVVAWLYREDRFFQGRLLLAGRPVGPENLTAPLLAVLDPRSRITPPRSIEPFLDVAGSRTTRRIRYGGDAGVFLQHVGALIGETAHSRIWPEIMRWLHATWTAREDQIHRIAPKRR